MHVPALVVAAVEGAADQPRGAAARRRGPARRSPTGSTLVDPSDSRTPVPAAATCMTALAWSADGVVHASGRPRATPQRGAVVVGAVVQRRAAGPRRRAIIRRDGGRAVGAEDRLRWSRSGSRSAAARRRGRATCSSRSHSLDHRLDLLGRADLGQGHDEPVRQARRGRAGRRGTGRACAARACGSAASRLLKRMPTKWRSRGGAAASVARRRASASASSSSSAAVAVAVLEVDPQVLDRLALQLAAHPVVELGHQVGRAGRAPRPARAPTGRARRGRPAPVPPSRRSGPGGSGRPGRRRCAPAGGRPRPPGSA